MCFRHARKVFDEFRLKALRCVALRWGGARCENRSARSATGSCLLSSQRWSGKTCYSEVFATEGNRRVGVKTTDSWRSETATSAFARSELIGVGSRTAVHHGFFAD